MLTNEEWIKRRNSIEMLQGLKIGLHGDIIGIEIAAYKGFVAVLVDKDRAAAQP